MTPIPDQKANEMKEQLAELANQRDQIEIEVEAAMSRLNEAEVGMYVPLVDKEVGNVTGCISEVDRRL